MDVLIAKLNRWSSYNDSQTRSHQLAEAIQTVCPGATDLNSLGSLQLYDLISILHDTTELQKANFLPLWEKCFEQEKNDKLCESIHGLSMHLRGANNSVADTIAVADATDVAVPETQVAPDNTSAHTCTDIHKWNDENHIAIELWRKQMTPYSFHAPIVTRYCCAYGLVDKLDLCKMGGYEFPDDLYNLAIYGGHLDVVKWLHDHNYVDNRAQAYAAARGQLAILKYLIAKNGHVDEDTCVAAVMSGDIEIVQYLIVRGGNAAIMKEIAAERDNTEIVEWISLMTD